MFHWTDGWYFARTEDDSVQIEKRESAHEDAPVVVSAVIDADSWASIVASVAARGETGDTWRAARAFHNQKD